MLATNAMSLELNSLANRAEPKFTLAVATAPLTDSQIEKLGLASRRSFYTVDSAVPVGQTSQQQWRHFRKRFGSLAPLERYGYARYCNRSFRRTLCEHRRPYSQTASRASILCNLLTAGAGQFYLPMTGVRYSRAIRKARTQSCSAHIRATAWPSRFISVAGPPKSCLAVATCQTGSASRFSSHPVLRLRATSLTQRWSSRSGLRYDRRLVFSRNR